MPVKHIDINLVLVPAIDDPPLRGDLCQSEIRAFVDLLRRSGVELSGTGPELRGVWSPEPVGAILSADFAIKFAATIVPPLITGIAGWLHGRNGRRVHLRVKDVEVDAPSIAEVERLLAHAQRLIETSDNVKNLPQKEN